MATVTKTSPLLVVVPADLSQRLLAMAEASDRSIQAEIREALRNHVTAKAD